jgi:hypothetical protein
MTGNILKPMRKAAERLGLSEAPTTDEKETIPSISLDLPSNGVFYNGVRTVNVSRTLSVSQIRMLYGSRSHTSEYNKLRDLVNVIGRSIHGIDFLGLTWPDFRYIMYWLRLNTYKPAPYSIQWEYTPVGAESPKTVMSRISIVDYRIIELDRHKSYGYEYETVRMHLERLELESEEERWVAGFAVSYPRGATLRERMDALDCREDSVLVEIRQFQTAANHGLFPKLKLTDPENPGAGSFDYELVLEAEDFFPL